MPARLLDSIKKRRVIKIRNVRLISGSSCEELSTEISKILKIPLCKRDVKKFANGEIYVRIGENVRGRNIFIIQSLCKPINDYIMELLLLIDAAKRASANRVTVIIPYYAYGRQDRKAKPREPISAKLFANMLTEAGADRIISVDMHVDQIQGFFDIPVDDLWGLSVLVNYFIRLKLKNTIVVAPDAGAIKRSKVLAKMLEAPIALIDKRRPKHQIAEVMNIIGDVKGKNAIIADDMIDTGGTIIASAKAIKDAGAKNVYICATHPIFSKDAVKRLQNSAAKEVIVTNSLPFKGNGKVKVVSLGKLLAEAIYRVSHKKSVSGIYGKIIKIKQGFWK